MEHLLSDLGKYDKMIRRMQDGYTQKEHDLGVCRQRLQEVEERAA